MDRYGRRRIFGWALAATLLIVVAAIVVAVVFAGPRAGHVQDEALRAGRDAKTLAGADEDYFHDMDMVAVAGSAKALPLTPAAIQGRNTWMAWTGGNDRFWDKVSQTTFGNFDLLKVISSYPGWPTLSRDNRFAWLGLVNEPCFQKPTAPRADRFGLWLDVRKPGCGADPFENEQKYPGVKIGARGATVPVGSYWGYATGVLGLRLFPNPDFDEKAAKRWDPVRFYTDPSYYNSKDLVRPYRVGMSCAFCHVGPSPVNPPADPENPQYANVSGTVGAQYYWVDRIFSWRADEKNYLYQLFHTSHPGALDTSLVSTDYINNPRTMNAVYQLGPRLTMARQAGREILSDSNLQNRQLPAFFEKPRTVWSPHVLKDGSDSVGALGALNRVYLNIGLFSEEWLLHFNAFIGGQTPTPIRISTARANSSYWNATELQTEGMAAYLLAASGPHHLADAPGGAAYLAKDSETAVAHGGEVFAERCARCHSSKLPPIPKDANPASCEGKDYLACWNRYWAWSQTPAFRDAMKAMVANRDEFLKDNFLSTDMRVPVSLLRTNLCSPLATNAIKGSIWDDFSSDTYKALPSVGAMDVVDPITGQTRRYAMPAGGRGYTRPASLVALWSTGPYLLNNRVGPFDPSPSVASRMGVFDASIRQMLWPETRPHDSVLTQSYMIDRLRSDAYLRIPAGYLPGLARDALGPLSAVAPELFVKGASQVAFQGATQAGARLVTGVWPADPTATFVAGQPVTGPGLAAGTRVARYDAATRVLALDRPATATQGAATLSVRVPDEGVRIGPIAAGTPVNLLAAVEVAPETHDLGLRLRHDWALVNLALGVKGDARRLQAAKTDAERAEIRRRLDERLLAMSKCPDYEVNRGHYFGTNQLPEEPGLSDADKEALIAFLKRL